MVMVAAAAACTETVDTSTLEPVGDYTTWKRTDATGAIPAHQDTYRITYANPISTTYAGAGYYPVGSVFIKEIRDVTSDGMPGELRYIALMRKLAAVDPLTNDDDTFEGFELEGGWLFTFVGDTTAIGGDEKTGNCWQSCHVQAPYDGAWIDHGL
jgi:hypothetical protein